MSHLAPSSRPISTTPSPRHSITLQSSSPSPSPSPLSMLPTLHSSPSSVSGSPASSHARQDSVTIQIPNGRRENGLLRDPSFSSLGQRSQSHLMHSASSAAIARTNESDGENNGLGFTSLVGLVKSMSLPDIPLLTEKNEDHHSDDDLEMTSEGRALVTNGNTEKVMVQSPSQNRLSRRGGWCCPEEFRAHIRFAIVHASYEWQLIRYHKWILILAVIWQYVHKVATNVAYYLHVPGQPLYDLGFQFIPALSKDLQILSEILFFCLFLSTFVFCATPFIKCLSPNANPKSKVQLYAVQMLARYSAVLVMAQTLRSISFLVTLLPGPNYHCRSGSEEYDPPRTLYVILTRMDAFFGCGDLVFSSHTIFVLMCALTITKYAPISRFKKIILWILVIIFGMFVVAARKHYTLDIVVALYTVPLLWIAYEHYFPDYIPPELFAHLPPEVHDRDRSMTSVE